MLGDKPVNIETWLAELGNPSADRDYKPGHERMLQLLASLNLQPPKLRIRIAGTNGKGSTAFMLAAALASAGLKVGLYTSPHILAFNERIRINGVPVDDGRLLEGLGAIMPVVHRVGASYFETATVLALDQFFRAGVDVEILEAGVGARLDSTTAVPADMALITPIGLDHQDWLGDSVEAIALEKAYVMQGCRYCISVPQSGVVGSVLKAFNADMMISQSDQAWELLSPGLHQHINASLAWTAVRQLQDDFPHIDMAVAAAAIRRCRVPGRLQYVSIGQADVWLDAAHNQHAIEALLPSLPQLADPFDAILVFTRDDRSLSDALPLLQPLTRRLISNCAGPGVDVAASPLHSLQAEIQRQPQGNFLVLGSFITVAAVLPSVQACA